MPIERHLNTSAPTVPAARLIAVPNTDSVAIVDVYPATSVRVALYVDTLIPVGTVSCSTKRRGSDLSLRQYMVGPCQ